MMCCMNLPDSMSARRRRCHVAVERFSSWILGSNLAWRRAILSAALLAVSVPVAALEIPKPFSATYVGRPYAIGKLDAAITLERIGEHLRYTVRSQVSAPFYRNEFYECSVMAVRKERIYPLEYKHTDKNNAAKDLTGRFDWNTNTATVTRADGKETRIAGLVWPVWDPLSFQVGIMTELINGTFGTEKVYRLLARNGVRERRLRLTADEDIATAIAVLKAAQVERTDGKSERLWFAKEHGYIPVRIEIKNFSVELVSDPARAGRDSTAPGESTPRC